MMAGMDENHDPEIALATDNRVTFICSHGDQFQVPPGWVCEIARLTCADGEDLITTDDETGMVKLGDYYYVGPLTLDTRPQPGQETAHPFAAPER